MAGIHIGIDINSRTSEGVRVSEVKYGIITITVLDLGPEITAFPRYAVRRTLKTFKETFQSDVTYGEDIRETCGRALAFDGRACYDRKFYTEAYNLAADYIDSSAYGSMTQD